MHCILVDLTDTDILSFKLQHHPGMTQNHLCHLRCRRLLQMLSRFKIMQDPQRRFPHYGEPESDHRRCTGKRESEDREDRQRERVNECRHAAA